MSSPWNRQLGFEDAEVATPAASAASSAASSAAAATSFESVDDLSSLDPARNTATGRGYSSIGNSQNPDDDPRDSSFLVDRRRRPPPSQMGRKKRALAPKISSMKFGKRPPKTAPEFGQNDPEPYFGQNNARIDKSVC